MKHFPVIIGKIPEVKIIVGVTSHSAVLYNWNSRNGSMACISVCSLNLGKSENRNDTTQNLKHSNTQSARSDKYSNSTVVV